jgi:hypothetical protein
MGDNSIEQFMRHGEAVEIEAVRARRCPVKGGINVIRSILQTTDFDAAVPYCAHQP